MNFTTYQLRIRNIDVGNGRIVTMLCDHQGLPFIGQTDSALKTKTGDLQEFTVNFLVDGKTVIVDPTK